MAGTGFIRLNERIGHELHSGFEEPGGIPIADNSTIHFGKFAQTGGREFRINIEPAGRERGNGAV